MKMKEGRKVKEGRRKDRRKGDLPPLPWEWMRLKFSTAARKAPTDISRRGGRKEGRKDSEGMKEGQ
jgi:hypothetical protein